MVALASSATVNAGFSLPASSTALTVTMTSSSEWLMRRRKPCRPSLRSSYSEAARK